MTKQVKLWLSILCLPAMLLFMVACEEGEEFLTPPTAEERLADGPWVYTAHSIEPGMVQGNYVIRDLYAQLDSCDQDDVYAFSSTGTFTLEQGEKSCTANVAQIIDNGMWEVNDDETELSLDFTNSNDAVYEISELTKKELVLLKKYTDNGINFTETLTYNVVD